MGTTSNLKWIQKALAFRRLPIAWILVVACLSGEIEARGQMDSLADRLVPILAPGTSCMAQNDALRLVIAGCADEPEGHLLLFSLDSDGLLLEAMPTTVSLPGTDGLDNFSRKPLALLFHPTLPLLYVWQDIEPHRDVASKKTTIEDHLSHLLIYAVDQGTLRLEMTTGSGPSFAFAQSRASMATDPQGTRLFVGNLKRPKPPSETQDPNDLRTQFSPGGASIGYYNLDEKGMPRPTRVPVEGKLDQRGLQEFQWRVQPNPTDIGHVRGQPTGLGFVAPNRHVVLLGGVMDGPAVWDTRNRRATLSLIRIPHPERDYAPGSEPGPDSPVLAMKGFGHNNIIGPHGTLPIIYGAQLNGPMLYRVEHAEGYPTMLPSTTIVSNAAFHSAPLTAGTLNPHLVVGGKNGLHMIMLDTKGRFTPEFTRVELPNPRVQAIAYSRRFDRLYVPVETLP